MPTVGITGHTGLPQETAELVRAALGTALARRPAPVHGVTCLADGADQLFAEAVLRAGGTFEVVLPAGDYRDTVVPPERRAAFDALLSQASVVTLMPFRRSGRLAYEAANVEMLRRCDSLLAVWDGEPVGRLGSTADVVRAAQQRNLPFEVIWPPGAKRRFPTGK